MVSSTHGFFKSLMTTELALTKDSYSRQSSSSFKLLKSMSTMRTIFSALK